MPVYWVRNKKGQVAAELSEKGLSVHDQGLSWQIYRMKHEGEAGSSNGAEETRSIEDWLAYFEESGYTSELRDPAPVSGPAHYK